MTETPSAVGGIREKVDRDGRGFIHAEARVLGNCFERSLPVRQARSIRAT